MRDDDLRSERKVKILNVLRKIVTAVLFVMLVLEVLRTLVPDGARRVVDILLTAASVVFFVIFIGGVSFGGVHMAVRAFRQRRIAAGILFTVLMLAVLIALSLATEPGRRLALYILEGY